MSFGEFDLEQRFRAAWEAVRIVRSVPYTLFTFGETVLPYFLVCHAQPANEPVTVRKGEVRVARPLIITPDSASPEFRNFFESSDDEDLCQVLLARTAAFSNLKVSNQDGPTRRETDSLDEVVARLSRQLDDDEEDRVAILTAPASLARFAVLRYTTERVIKSAPDNIQELRERGFLP